MSSGRRLRVVVVGHVDHGKSTLIGRIIQTTATTSGRTERDLAHVTDQFAEERAGGLTMDTAHALCRVAGREFVFIDVPGHRDLLRQMLTGATRAAAAVLVVAADEGVREQTRVHAELLSMLGLNGDVVIVAVNKMDAVGFSRERFEDVSQRAVDLLPSLRPAVIPVSAALASNIATPSMETPWYVGPTVFEALLQLEPVEPPPGPARFVVQETLPYEGTIVYAGRLLDGMIAAGDRLICHPDGGVATVERVVRFPADERPARAGESVALLLTGCDAARGCVFAAQAGLQPRVGTAVNAQVFWLDECPLHVGHTLRLRCATQEMHCTVVEMSGVALKPSPGTAGEGLGEGLLSTSAKSPHPCPLPEYREREMVEMMEMMAEVVLTTERPIVTEPPRGGRSAALGRLVLERAGVVAGAGVVIA